MKKVRWSAVVAVVAFAVSLPGCCLCKTLCPPKPGGGITPSPIRVAGLVKGMKNTGNPIMGTVRVGYEYDGGATKWLVTTAPFGATLGLNVGQAAELWMIANPTDPATGMPMVHDGMSLCEWANSNDPAGKPWALYVLDPENVVGQPSSCP